MSQSPWDTRPVLQAISDSLSGGAGVLAWTVDEVLFTKYGPHSAGVERQYSSLAGRVSNCQLGLAVSLVSDGAAVPINWRLMLPASWDADHDRRRRARIPREERHLPRWHHLMAAVDDVAENWPVPPAPVVTNAVTDTDVEPVLAAAEARELQYAIEVRGDLNGLLHVPWPGHTPAPPTASRTPMTLNAIARMAESRRQTASWHSAGGVLKRGQFVAVPVSPAGGPSAHRRVLLAEWPLALSEPRRYWLTNITDRSLSELVSLVKLTLRSRAAVADMQADYGLCDYEGRSYVGWHHHVALASAAYAFPIVESRWRNPAPPVERIRPMGPMGLMAPTNQPRRPQIGRSA